jgi:hypothetical protein
MSVCATRRRSTTTAERAEVFILTTSTYDWSPPVMVRLEAIGITQLREVSRTSQSQLQLLPVRVNCLT